MCEPEEGKVEGEEHEQRLLVDTPVLVQSPALEPPVNEPIVDSAIYRIHPYALASLVAHPFLFVFPPLYFTSE